MKAIVENFLKHHTDLPSPPAIAIRILEEIKKDECSLEGLSHIIEMDPALVTKILRISNASHYHQISKVDTLQRALSVLGLNAVKNIVLSFVLSGNFRGNKESAFNYDLFWRRSVTTAVGAELVTQLAGLTCPDIFLTALLQDIGMVFLYLCSKDEYNKVLEKNRFNLCCTRDAEIEGFGFDHQDFGAALLKEWGIPQTIYEPIGFHHSPKDAPRGFEVSAQIMFIADRISSLYHSMNAVEEITEIRNTLSDKYGINGDQVDGFIDDVASRTIEMLSIFDIPTGKMKPYSQILQEANAELGKLNLTYEQLVLEYKSAKESAEQMARDLEEANQKLRKLATTDGLTGLYNHRTFQDLIEKRIREANRHRRHLALILLDLDHFKSINDRYGHPIGDAVLKVVSCTLTKLSRSEDILARYGGEEFSIILPETDIKGAVLLAERIRDAIAKATIRIRGISLNITISLGVSAKNATQGECNKNALIEAADKALYLAKRSGRNTLRVSLLDKQCSVQAIR
jgi:diguanylate cyclase (GGDEF)-like protein